MLGKQKTSTLALGLALFAMFFGSGNLIYPLYVGATSKSQLGISSLAFVLTGVLLPFLGILVMVLFKGSYEKFFAQFGNKVASWAPWILLTIWIPLGSSPRCITLANSSINLFTGTIPAFLFGILYLLPLWYVLKNRSHIVDILGYVLTPLLLLCLFSLFIATFFSNRTFLVEGPAYHEALFTSLKQGYNTMDLIASFFFCSSIITLLKESEEKRPIRKVMHASIIGICLLTFVYVALIWVAAFNSESLASVAKDQLLVFLSKMILGKELGFVSAISILLACFTTSVALSVVYADFLVKRGLFKSYDKALALTLFISYGMSNFGLEGITMVTEPVLQVCYPILIVFILVTLLKLAYSYKRNVAVDHG